MEGKVVTGSRDSTSGRQSRAAGRQIKYWILGTEKKIAVIKKKQLQWLLGCHQALDDMGSQRCKANQPQWSHSAPTVAPAICDSAGYVWVGRVFGLQLN